MSPDQIVTAALRVQCAVEGHQPGQYTTFDGAWGPVTRVRCYRCGVLL